ncbi:bridge-like lipid transfer protein family member 3B [Argopecten irradians]|uniref:bridge-like lipid transfer protein family member 3B n=1 Tax=Argopecten irradians TaxID=31199 RepID=UPI003719FA0E
MASILKNQILKHLSKFTKNLSPDKINLSTLRGEGELSNLELDENILMDLMDLPTWMKLSKAVCNKLTIKIMWTKLKSQPISIFLDEVILEMETCDDPRPPNNPAHLASYRSGGKYGFTDRVIDGIYVHINAVSVKFMSRKFHASLQLSRVVVQSKTPNWQKTDDLRSSKIRESSRGEILLFKEVEWQTTRIEATAVEGETNDFLLTPLRLIANQSKIRITIKKNLSDCSIISTRVMLFLDDILWVLTDTQLKAAILYANSLRQMIEKSREQSKKLAADALLRQGQFRQMYPQQAAQRPRSASNATPAQAFMKYDVQTTSYHLISSRIDLHLCDDSSPDSNVRENPKHNKRIEGGAMQITFNKLSVDIYPFNPAGGERKHWYRYMDNQGSRNFWVQQLFAAFKQEVAQARETCCVASPTQSPAHEPANQRPAEKPQPTNQNPSGSRSPSQPAPHQQVPPIRVSTQRPRSTKLLESCTVLKIEEFIIYQVSTADNKRNTPCKFLSSDKKQLHLPTDMSVLHMEYTDYFFPEGINYPVPHANLYMLVNPIRLNLDYLTLLWVNFFMLNLSQSVTPEMLDDTPKQHVDIKIEALMPRVIVSAERKVENQPDRPEGVQLQVSKLCVTNTHVEDNTGRADLTEVLNEYNNGHLFTSSQYPNNNNPLKSVPPHFSTFASGRDNAYMQRYAKELVAGQLPPGMESQAGSEAIAKLLKTNTLKRNASFDIWCICADQAWLEFVGVPVSKSRPIPFVESVPVTLWFCMPLVMDEAETKLSQNNQLDVIGMSGTSRRGSSNANSHSSSPDRDYRASPQRDRPTRRLLKEYYSTDSESYDTSPDETPSCDNANQFPKSEDKGQSSQLATYNLVTKVGGPVKAQMNHSQFLFLMRLLESFTVFQTQLTADIEYFLGTSTSPTTFSVPLVVPDVEFVMVCPYVAELLPFTHNMQTSPSGASLRDGDLIEDVELKEEGSQQIDLRLESNIEDEDCKIDNSMADSGSQCSSHTAISKSLSDSRIQCHAGLAVTGEEELHNAGMFVPGQISHSSQGLSDSHHDSSSGYDSSFGSRGSGSQQMKKSANKAADQVKKSFSSALSGITGLTDKLKAKMDTNEEMEDIDSMSIKTDLSDDDLDFEMLNLEEAEMPAFHHPNIGVSETASSTDTDMLDDVSSLYAESSAATKGRELVSVIAFRIRGSELLMQSDGSDTAIRIQARHLSTNQPGNMYYEDFYNKFTSPQGIFGQTEVSPDDLKSFTIKLKIVSGPGADAELPITTKPESPGYLSVMAEKCGIAFNTSSLANMAKFVEDESSGQGLPMHVTVSDFHLSLKDDAPKPNIPPAPPVECMIHNLAISRGYDGVFHLTAESVFPSAPEVKETEEEQNVEEEKQATSANQSLFQENQRLQKSLEEMSNLLQKEKQLNRKVNQDNANLQKEKENLQSKLNKTLLPSNGTNESEVHANAVIAENLKLQHKVISQEDEINTLIKEKNSLLDTLKLLQDELLESESRRRRFDHHS